MSQWHASEQVPATRIVSILSAVFSLAFFSLPGRRVAAVLLSAALAAVIARPTPIQANEHERDDDRHVLRVMTQNMYEGTNFQEFAAAQTPQQFFAAVTVTYQDILATQPAERAAAMAREIAKERPDLVALHEASKLRIGPLSAPGTPPSATIVKMDLLQSLLDELEKLGEHYFLVGAATGLDIEAPSTLGFDVRITEQDAIIARRHIDMVTIASQVHHFSAMQTTQTALGPIPTPVGWVSLDAVIRGQPVRFVSVHLSPGPSIPIQLAQAKELVEIAGATTLPLVFGGDFNADNDPSNEHYPVYQALIKGGLKDAWKRDNPGFTCCQDFNLLNPTSKLSVRIDLILYRGDFDVEEIEVVGDKRSDKTPSGLWPSDHAGVAATLHGPHRRGEHFAQEE
jgi:endonuclease/exonuclease/phosphatase family metal-dependent hydrolase